MFSHPIPSPYNFFALLLQLPPFRNPGPAEVTKRELFPPSPRCSAYLPFIAGRVQQFVDYLPNCIVIIVFLGLGRERLSSLLTPESVVTPYNPPSRCIFTPTSERRDLAAEGLPSHNMPNKQSGPFWSLRLETS